MRHDDRNRGRRPDPRAGLAALAIALAGAGEVRGEGDPAAPTLSFERDVRPVLKAYCLDCHGGAEELKGGLDLRLRRFAERGGKGGSALTPGDPDASLLLIRMQDGEMPPSEKKVPPDQVALVGRWIAAGAPTLNPEPESLPPGVDITPEEREFWAFRPIRRPEVPATEPADRARTPIDAFVLEKLRPRGLGFAPEADKRTLIRRAALDLTGLPPTPADLDSYLADEAEGAYERMVDRLLASPRYGEHWARHWLDVAGYADSEGNGNEDTPRQFASKYRDYVIRALNADKPLDQFIAEQLAGDELVPRPWKDLTPEQVDLLAATGFLRMVPDPTATGGGDEALNANQVVADAIKVLGSSLLGLTVGCAQCHDHRYDPIPQSDYFRLRAVLEPALDPNHWRRPAQRLVSLITDADRAKTAAIEAEASEMRKAYDAKAKTFLDRAVAKELEKFPEDLRGKLRAAYDTPEAQRTEEQKALLAANPSANISPGVLYQYDPKAADELKADQQTIDAKLAERPPGDYVAVLDEVAGVRPETRVFHRGDHRQPKQAVGPGDLTIAAPPGRRFEIADADPAAPSTGRRLALARHLTSGTHPLVGRVLVNRIWLHHFGRGLVDTPGDFGRLGRTPSHPELLDWLASELPGRGWSLKALHRRIVGSTVYRQASTRDPSEAERDPGNLAYSRFPIRRLDAEAVRDRVLEASGRLDPTMYGPAVAVTEDTVGQVIPADDSARRSVYLQVRRTRPESFLASFDAPTLAPNCDRRTPSTSPTQALMLMNSDFVLRNAKAMAARVRSEAPAGPADRRYPRPGEAWAYGIGRFDESSQRVEGYLPLLHWTGSAWQGGPALPDPATGWSTLNAAGGHPGDDAPRSVIRRWVAPRDGIVAVSGTLKHASQGGDGVRARLVSTRLGPVGAWTAARSEAATPAAGVAVRAGDALDFVVDCLGEVSCDSFAWPVRVVLSGPDGRALGGWDSEADFRGPTAPPLPAIVARAWQVAYRRPISAEELGWACDFVAARVAANGPAGGDAELAALTDLCQQLLSSNEFLYVD